MYCIKFERDYCGHNFYIKTNGKRVGYISISYKKNIIFIYSLQIYDEYQNKGIGRAVVSHLFNNHKRDYIVGESLKTSRTFWAKMIKEFNGTRKNISDFNDCSSSFILCKDNNIKCNKCFKNNKEFYDFLLYCNSTKENYI